MIQRTSPEGGNGNGPLAQDAPTPNLPPAFTSADPLFLSEMSGVPPLSVHPEGTQSLQTAADVPEPGYVLLYSAYENGWAPGKPTKITYSEQGGLTVDNGLRTVLSNLDISPFAIKSYSVHGMKGSTDPPAVTHGVFTVKIISANYGENPLWIFPFVVTGIVGAGVIILIFSKRRS